MITYSDLVQNVQFDLSNLKHSPRVIDVHDWHELDRAIIGDFLGYISMRSYQYGSFFASALVVTKLDGSPGWGFYNLLKELKIIPSSQSEEALDIWADHVRKAHTWYQSHPRS